MLLLQFGVIVLTTSAGIMDHEEARRKKVGGKVSVIMPSKALDGCANAGSHDGCGGDA